ncbi:MAG: UUP1 family membrane protein [Pseudomonadota bacterium]
MKHRQAQRQIRVIVALLLTLGIGTVWYKYTVLGFPLLASETQDVWRLEARLSFTALGGPVTARLNMPDPIDTLRPVFSTSLATAYDFRIERSAEREEAVWTRPDAPPGPEEVTLYTELFFADLPGYSYLPPSGVPSESGTVDQAILNTVSDYVSQRELDGAALVSFVLRELNNPVSELWLLLQRDSANASERLQLAIDILAGQAIAAMSVAGVELKDRQRNRPPKRILMVYLDEVWQGFDPGAALALDNNRFLPMQQGGESIFEVSGGEDSNLQISVVRTQRASFLNAVENARQGSSWLIDFSIYSLPVDQQSTFKLLLLIPLGALVVVILRNIVGIRTSGTFMPILIALTFLQTSLFAGLVLFLAVVSLGLLMRSYLSQLNLLLVPRIASVLVFVIIIYAAIGIASHKLGLRWGMAVTFFPMIILAWTIERMSILWDEEGAREVLVQGSGSLLTACIAYLLMANKMVADTVFLYPEALLIVLAVIIGIGSYSGYRLSDLRRFAPMERY